MGEAPPFPRLSALGEQGLVVELGDRIDPAVNARVRRLARAVRSRLAGEALEVVPSYRSLLVVFDPLRVTRARLELGVRALLDAPDDHPDEPPGRLVEIPVCYGGEHGPDLAAVAAGAGLAVEEAVALHASAEYLVHMLGFSPGFPYLGGLPTRLATPRLPSPRVRVPAGSVGIAGDQTGIYPVASPGGWRLVGRTPRRLFDPAAAAPFLLAAGDRVRFVPVGEAEYRAMGREEQGRSPGAGGARGA
jgi:inhibitor of KinA